MRLLKILRQDLENILHNPTLIFSNTVLPLILIGVMGFVTKGGFGTELVSSFDYYGVNMLIFSVGMIAITATNAFMEEQVKRGNFRIAYAPVSKQEIYLSKILSSYLLSAVCYSVLVLGFQYILGLNMGGRNCIYFTTIFKIIPQTEFMELVHGVEFGGSYIQFRYGIIYILLWVFVLLIAGVRIAKNRIAKGKY